MEAPSLTIRNLTSTPTELKIVERYEAATEAGCSSTSRTFLSLISNATRPSTQQLANHTASFVREEVSIRIAPYETVKTDIPAGGHHSRETVRLTFETEGERYRLDTPTPSHRSTVLTPLSPNPRFEYTAVYLPKVSYLALFSSANLESWMSNLLDESPLHALSIPGTHNSATHYPALPSVRCQVATLKEQLDNGVRFFDFRLQPAHPHDLSRDGLILVHAVWSVSLYGTKYFRELVDQMLDFLDRNPTETLIISVKREGAGKATDQQLSKILHKHYANDRTRWFTENRIPYLGEVRGKIVVIRRFKLHDDLKSENGGTGWCIDAESWPDNCTDGICSSGEIRVQDFYTVEETVNIEKKIKYTHAHFERAASAVCLLPGDPRTASFEARQETASQTLYLNFLSASNFFRPGCWPDRIAAKVNPAIVDFLCRRHNEPDWIEKPHRGEGSRHIGDGSTGIVVCDWVGHKGDWDLIRCIVGHNAKLEIRERKL